MSILIVVSLAWEASLVDGALPLEVDLSSFPAVSDSYPLNALEWALEQISRRACRFLTFDIKFQGLAATTYTAFSSFNLGTGLCIVQIEGFPDYWAMIPGTAVKPMRGANGARSGRSEISTVALLYPFMVHQRDMRTALDRWMACVRDGQTYTNPTTKVTLTGCRPFGVRAPHITPTHELSIKSFRAIQILASHIRTREPEVELTLNQYMPLVADFNLILHRISRSARIEHKFRDGDQGATGRLECIFGGSPRHPFHRSRLWDFIIWQFGPRLNFICIPRHEVPKEWADSSQVQLNDGERQRFTFVDEAGLREMLRYIEHNAERAAEQVRMILHDRQIGGSADDNDLESLLPSDLLESEALDDQIQPVDDEFEDDSDDDSENPTQDVEDTLRTEEETQIGRGERARSLRERRRDRIVQVFNEFFSTMRRGLMFGLDDGHCSGDLVAVDFEWPVEAGVNLPEFFSADIADHVCVVLRLWDMSQSILTPGSLAVRRSDLEKPMWSERSTLIIGDTTLLDLPIDHRCSWVLLPSQMTTVRTEHSSSAGDSQGHDGSAYIRRIDKSGGTRSTGHLCQALKPGDGFLRDPDLHPETFILSIQQTCQRVYDFLTGKGSNFSFDNPQGGPTQYSMVCPRDYHTTPKDINQAAWSSGCKLLSKS